MVSVPTGKIFEGPFTGASSSSRIALRVSTGPLIIQLLRVSISITSAPTAASYVPRIYDESAGVAGSINQRFLGSSTAVADLFDVAVAGTYLQTDVDGYLYLEVGPNAGSDTAGNYSLIYQVI